MQKQTRRNFLDWVIIWNRLPILLFIVATATSLLFYSSLPSDIAPLALVMPIASSIGVLLVVRPQLLLIITVVYFPLENVPWFDSFLPAGLSVSKILGALLVGAILFNIFFRKEKFRFFDNSLDYTVMLFCVAIFFSSMFSPVPEKIIDELDRVLRLVAFYFAVKNLVDSPRVMYLLLIGLFFTSVYATLSGIYEYLTTTTQWGYAIRVSGINENPNNFAFFSNMAIAIGLQIMQIKDQKLWLRGAIALGTLILMLGVVMSGSRGGMLSTGVVAGFFILSLRNRILISTIAIATLLITFPFWPDQARERILPSTSDFQNTYQESASNSTERRTAYLIFGAELVVRSPIVGNGYRSFSQLFSQSKYIFYDNPIDPHDLFRVAHNVYLETLTGTGMLGLFSFLSMLFIGWRSAYRSATRFEVGSIERATAHAVEFGLIAYCISSVFISSEQFKQLWFLLGMASAIHAYAHYQHGLRKDEKTLTQPTQIVTL